MIVQERRAAAAQDSTEAVARTERVEGCIEAAVTISMAHVARVSGLAEEVSLPAAGRLEGAENYSSSPPAYPRRFSSMLSL